MLGDNTFVEPSNDFNNSEFKDTFILSEDHDDSFKMEAPRPTPLNMDFYPVMEEMATPKPKASIEPESYSSNSMYEKENVSCFSNQIKKPANEYSNPKSNENLKEEKPKSSQETKEILKMIVEMNNVRNSNVIL